MCQRTIFSKSFFRIAEEVQLQAEEEWIIEALKKIKQQRNCLQIERLHLESLKAKLKDPEPEKPEAEKPKVYDQHVSAVNMMNPTLGIMRQQDEFEVMDDALCNEQELNLMVTKPMYSPPQKEKNPFDFDMEEESDDDEEEDSEDVIIDINMLMNGDI